MKKDDWEEFRNLDEEIFPDDAVSRESFEKRVEHEGFFALEIDSKRIVGCLILSRFGDDAGHLGRIGVAPLMQKRGLGTKLMDFAFRWL